MSSTDRLQEFFTRIHHESNHINTLKMLLNEDDICEFLIKLMDAKLLSETCQFLKCVSDVPEAIQLIFSSIRIGDMLDTVAKCQDLKIKSALLKLCTRAVSNGGSNITGIESVFESAVSWIASDDLELSESSCDVVDIVLCSKATLVDHGLSMITSRYLSSDDSTLKLRYASVFSKVLKVNDELFSKCEASGAVHAIVELCQSTDVLVAVVALEFLECFTTTVSGLLYLLQHGLIKWMLELACGAEGGLRQLPDPVLGQQALRILAKVFEKVTSFHVPIWTSPLDIQSGSQQELGTGFLYAIVRHMEAADEGSLLAGLYAVSNFAISSKTALTFVLQDALLLDAWLSLLNRKVELQAATLHSIAKVLDVRVSEAAPTDTAGTPTSSIPEMELKRALVSAVARVKNSSPLKYLLKLAKEPVTPLKHAAYDVLRALVAQPEGWGLELLMTYEPGQTWDFLRNTTSETDKEGKVWKFSVLEAICSCPQRVVLGSEMLKQLEDRLKQGPFYVEARMAEMLTMEH